MCRPPTSCADMTSLCIFIEESSLSPLRLHVILTSITSPSPLSNDAGKAPFTRRGCRRVRQERVNAPEASVAHSALPLSLQIVSMLGFHI